MSTTLRFRRRAAGGAVGAPSTLKTAEPAFNMADGFLYVGFGDDGSGNATSIKRFAKDDFLVNIPAGGTNGQALVKTGDGDGQVGWATITSGGTYSVTGTGLALNGTQFSLNYGEISVGLGLPGLFAGKSDVGHTHAANDITSGTFDAARIPTLDASKIGTGVLDIARIPVLPGNTTLVAASNIGSLTAPQQANIAAGTIITTTDGRRWVYSGTGSKTAEASYVELADITPEWSAVGNKPIFATVATTGAYADLSGRPTLGTMAGQNANAVAITGGTITGITLDGGTF